MPSAPGKGKVPLGQVKEYDPHHDAAQGKGREYHEKRRGNGGSKKKK